jgi:RHS repeat-associated protein
MNTINLGKQAAKTAKKAINIFSQTTIFKRTRRAMRKTDAVRKTFATLSLVALMLPIIMPVPAFAARELTPEEQFAAKLFELPESEESLAESGKSFLSSSINLLNRLIGADLNGDNTGDAEKNGDKESSSSIIKAIARRAKVKRIHTGLSREKEIMVGKSLLLNGLPVDENGDAVHGIVAEWHSSDKSVLEIDEHGNAVALKPGVVELTAKAGTAKEVVKISVVEENSEISKSTAEEARAAENKDSLKNKSKAPAHNSAISAPAFVNSLPDTERNSVYSAQNNLGSPMGQVEMDSPNVAAALPIKHRVGIANYSFDVSLATLSGRGINAEVGMTYNSRTWNTSCAQYGTTGNCIEKLFTYDVDASWIAPGFTSGFGHFDSYFVARRILWKSGSSFVEKFYNEVVPSGFTDSDGTRHQVQCKSWAQIPGAHISETFCTKYETSDGSFVKVDFFGQRMVSNYNSPQRWIYNATYFVVTHTDGTIVTYSTPLSGSNGDNRRHFPVKIQDSNGNFINIAYKDASGKIDYIRDTMNRYIRFNYESDPEQRLVSVTVPGFGENSQDRQTIRFYYENINLDVAGRFSGQATAPPTIRTLKFVYFPGTQTGFRYDYHPNFGMIKKISQLRGMEISSALPNVMGAVTSEGTWAATTEYNYPNGSDPLPDVPKYTERTDDWRGRTSAAAVTLYDVTPTPTPGQDTYSTITVKDTDFDIEYRTVSHNTTDWQAGLVKETTIKKLYGPTRQLSALMSKTVTEWEQEPGQFGARKNPRIKKVEVTNEAGQTRATTYEYGAYNNPRFVREYDFATPGVTPTELRHTETAYQNNSGWINNNLLHLPVFVKTVVNGTAVSLTEYEYDYGGGEGQAELNMTPRSDIQQFEPRYNVFDPVIETDCQYVCPQGCENPAFPNACDCPLKRQCVNEGHYDPQTDFRGNITKIKHYAAPTNPNDPLASVTTMKYDIAGNPVEAIVNCCQKKTWSYGANWNVTGYAYPTTETQGANNELSSKVEYDKNTGLVKKSFDENDQLTSYTYDPANLRLIQTDYPNGRQTTIDYHELVVGREILLENIEITSSLDTGRAVMVRQYLDGRGLTVRSFGPQVGGLYQRVTDIKYDSLGRVALTSNPYTAFDSMGPVNPSGKWTKTAYDALGRAAVVTLPDNTTIQTDYNHAAVDVAYPDSGPVVKGTATTITDQAQKKRRQIVDALGRVIRVDEPNTSGLLDGGNVNSPYQPTFYEYDGLDNLTKVIQSGSGVKQIREFKYDALSRLTHEKQVEALPTLNNEWMKVSTGGLWTALYKYNMKGFLDESMDARGVKTKFVYEDNKLNRLASITYSGETDAVTPTVTYSYDEARTDNSGNPYFNKGRLTTVSTATLANTNVLGTAQRYDYDRMGQVIKQQQTVGASNYTQTYGYNLAGQLINQTYPSGRTITNDVDSAGRLEKVKGVSSGSTNPVLYASGLIYNTQGLLSNVTYGNGSQESFNYDPARLQLTSQSLTQNNSVLQRFDYSYGEVNSTTGVVDATKNNGQIGKIENFIGGTPSAPVKQHEQRFVYDSIGRLKQAIEIRSDTQAQSYQQTFSYDRFGNRYLKSAENPSPLDPLALIEESNIDKQSNRFNASTTAVAYDEAGNLLTDERARPTGYAYDANGRMRRVAFNSAFGSRESIYDALGQRVATNTNGTWKVYVYDIFGKLIAEYGASEQGSTNGTSYLHQDFQGSTRSVTDQSGTIKARFDYTAFGSEIGAGTGQRTSQQGFNAQSAIRQKYAQTERDDFSGLDHTWWRKLDSTAGRWTSPDPYKGSMSVSDPQSFNRYSYVENDPMNFVDPDGLNQSIVFIYPTNCRPNPNWETDADKYICDVGIHIMNIGGGSSGGEIGGGGGGNTSNSSLPNPLACATAASFFVLWYRCVTGRNPGIQCNTLWNQFIFWLGICRGMPTNPGKPPDKPSDPPPSPEPPNPSDPGGGYMTRRVQNRATQPLRIRQTVPNRQSQNRRRAVTGGARAVAGGARAIIPGAFNGFGGGGDFGGGGAGGNWE